MDKRSANFFRGQVICSVLGECIPGGTTTALCVLRALGYPATVSSSLVQNPVNQKEAFCRQVLTGIAANNITDPIEIIKRVGDPMIPVAAGIANTYTGTLVLAGGTQMLAVCGVIKAMNDSVPAVATTVYVRDDRTANVQELAEMMGISIYYVDPGFGRSSGMMVLPVIVMVRSRKVQVPGERYLWPA